MSQWSTLLLFIALFIAITFQIFLVLLHVFKGTKILCFPTFCGARIIFVVCGAGKTSNFKQKAAFFQTRHVTDNKVIGVVLGVCAH